VQKAESTNPHVILEIGVQNGGSLKFWERLVLPGDLVIGVDIVPCEEMMRWDWRKSDRQIVLITGDSTDPKTVEAVKQALNGKPVDFLHIDGCHGVYPEGSGGKLRELRKCLINVPRKDFENYSPFVRSGGVVLIADLGEPCPHELWESLSGRKEKCGVHPHLGHGAWFKP